MKITKSLAVFVGSLLAQAAVTSHAQQFPAQQYPTNAPRQSAMQSASTPGVGQPTLRNLKVDPAQLSHIANALGLKYGYLENVNIGSDPARGELVILAPQSLQIQIDQEIRQMLASGVVQVGNQAISTANTTKQFNLRKISWREFEDALQTLSGQKLTSTTRRNGELASFELVDQPIGRATVEVDRRSNAVTVVAPEPTIVGWDKIIASIDVQNVRPGDVLEMARLENAEPAPIQRAIMLLRQLREGDAPGAGDTIGVAGNNVRFMGTALNPQEGGAAAPQPAQGSEAPQGGEGGEAEAGGLFGDVQIQFVPELGVIVARGSKRDVQRVMSVIKEIEAAATTTQPVIEVVEMKHVDNEAVADLVRQLYTDVLNTRGSSLSITGLGTPNALLLIGRQEAIDAAMELIEKLDVPVAPATQLKVFRLEHASALDAEATVRSFFSERPGSADDELRPVLGPRVRIIADFRTNSLIVQAAPRDLAEVSKLIRDLDVNQVPAQSEIRIFALKNALAEDLQPVLQEAITGEGDGQTNDNFTRPSTALSILAVDADGSRVIDSGLLAGVLVTADNNANALVVRAPSNSMPLIAELISQLDQLPGAESVVKVFQLENSDAVSITTALTQLFTGQQTAGGFGGAANALNIPLASASGENSLVQLRFTSDARTNSVIAVGALSDLEVVESVLLRLDTEGFSARRTEVIWLRNANALAVATAVQDYVAQRQTGINTLRQQQATQSSGSAVAVADLVDRDLIVVAEAETNSLLLSVSPRFYDTIRRLIDQLDRRPPMIMVKVVLAEVSLNDGFEWGTELGLQDSLIFDRGITGTAANPGFNFNGNGTPNASTASRNNTLGQSLSSFGVGRSSDAFGYGGFVLAAASDSVSVLLRSLHDAGRLQILSRPMVMTRDNTEALVQVGQTVPRPTDVVVNNNATQVQTTDTEVGLILRIVPRVGADGFIRMDIDTERSALDPSQGIPIGFGANNEPIESPIINRTRAQSTIQAYSGQTVIFGGLVQKSRTVESRRVPYLSSIPYLGALFRYDREQETRSELLIVMTPMVVSGEEDLDYIKAEESNRMSYCLADIVEMHGDVGLGGGYGLWGPAIGPVIYPDMTPMMDDIEILYEGGSVGDGSSVIELPQGTPVSAVQQGPPSIGGPAQNYGQAMNPATQSGQPLGYQGNVPSQNYGLNPAQNGIPATPGYPVQPTYYPQATPVQGTPVQGQPAQGMVAPAGNFTNQPAGYQLPPGQMQGYPQAPPQQGTVQPVSNQQPQGYTTGR